MPGAGRRAPPELPGHARGSSLSRYAPVRAEIESFWLPPEHRQVRTWLDHEDINDVMLATSLVPEGFLALPPVH